MSIIQIACFTCPHFKQVLGAIPPGGRERPREAQGRCTLNPVWVEAAAGHYCGRHPDWKRPQIGGQPVSPPVSPTVKQEGLDVRAT